MNNNNIYFKIENGQHVLKIVNDEDALNPREEINLGTMLCWHKGYSLGDVESNDYKDVEEFYLELLDITEEELEDLSKQQLLNMMKDKAVILPLYLYEHSGLSMSTCDFNDRWDSGQVGYIYITNEEIIKEYGKLTEETKQEALNALKNEVEIYDYFLRGEVYGYILEKKEKCEHCGNIEEKEVESCWGYYGSDIRKNGIYEDISKEFQELIQKEFAH